ncbi:hypothetical protein ACVDG8_027255 [Mesorhizobium sp. ORM8.1]
MSALTVSQLRRSDGIDLPCVGQLRVTMLSLAVVWSGALCWQVPELYSQSLARRVLALFFIGLAMMVTVASWLLLFWIW